MSGKLSRARILLWLAGITGVIFLLSGIGVAIYAPVKGSPLYIKLLLGAVFFAGVVYSFRLEKRGDRVVPSNRDTTPSEDREKG